jgi:hypothetical protein
MNLEHPIQTIAKRGFTERQARFLILVARHSGVCVMRQYRVRLLAMVSLLGVSLDMRSVPEMGPRAGRGSVKRQPADSGRIKSKYDTLTRGGAPDVHGQLIGSVRGSALSRSGAECAASAMA